MSTLILLSAIPGSGKSTWAKRYLSEHPNTYIVSSDEVRIKVSGSRQNFEHEDLVWKTFLEDLNEHADEDCTVIADATNLQNRYRSFYCINTPKFDKHILVVFKITFEICLGQNRSRPPERVVRDEAMVSLQKEFEDPTQEIIDLYDEYYLIQDDYIMRRIK